MEENKPDDYNLLSFRNTLEYRIKGGENNRGVGLDMARLRGWNNRGGGCLEKLKIVVFLANKAGTSLIYIYLCEQ